MKRKWILVFIGVMMGMTACSSETKEGGISVNMESQQETDQEQTVDTVITETNGTEPSRLEPPEADGIDIGEMDIEDIPQGDPIAGIVDAYDGSTITVRTPEDDMCYRFSAENVPVLEGYSTEGAQAAEKDIPIAVGDKVEVTYRGLLDDEEHPIDAVKIVVIPAE